MDRKAIKAKRGPEVHSSFTLLLRAAPYVSLIHYLLLAHICRLTHTHTHILSTSCFSSVPSELLLSAEPSRLKETVHLNVHNLLSQAHSWSHCSPVAPQRSSPGERRTQRQRFYPGTIQWPGQKHRLVKARQSERASGTLDIYPLGTSMPTRVFILSRHQVPQSGERHKHTEEHFATVNRLKTNTLLKMYLIIRASLFIFLTAAAINLFSNLLFIEK